MISSTGSLAMVSSTASIGSWRTETDPIMGWPAASCGGAGARSPAIGRGNLVVHDGVALAGRR